MATKNTDVRSESDLSTPAGDVSSDAMGLPDLATHPQEKESPIVTINAENDFV